MLIKCYFQRQCVDNIVLRNYAYVIDLSGYKYIQVGVENDRYGVYVFSILPNINATQITEACS